MKKTVDARGLSCPQPVVLTKKALEEPGVGEVLTIVDNTTALENVTRLINTMKMDSNVDEEGGDYYITINKSGIADEVNNSKPADGDVVILVGSNTMGQGDDELGKMLIRSYFYTLTEMESGIKSVLFLNTGVYLTIEGSELLDHIKILEEKGIEILSCGTCLDFFKHSDKLRVGSVTNMYTIAERLSEAGKVITLP